MRAFEDYVDAQHGGPGKGWYRIVTTPDQARSVINAGKLAVVMGIETSVPFDCTQKLGVPDLRCIEGLDRPTARRGPQARRLADGAGQQVRQRACPASPVTRARPATWSTAPTPSRPVRRGGCRPASPNDAEVHDKDQDNSVPVDSGRHPGAGRPVRRGARSSPASTCPPCRSTRPSTTATTLGLTELGEHTIRGLAERNMLFDPDHMSVKARKASLDLVESMGYSGVLSSHSWSTPGRLPAHLRGQGLHRAVRRGQHRLRREVEAPPDLGQPGHLLGLRVRRRHQRPRRPGRPAPQRRERPSGDLPVHHPRRRHGRPSRSAASASTTSTRTAWRTTASTPTGSRT